MNEEPSNTNHGSCAGAFGVLVILVFGLRFLITLSKQEPPPPDLEKSNKVVKSIMKSVNEADDTDFRSPHGGLKAAMQMIAQLQKRPEALMAIETCTVSPTDGKLIAHVKRDFPSAPADKQDKVMDQIARLWQASPYVQKHGYSGAVEFVDRNNWKRERPAPQSNTKAVKK